MTTLSSGYALGVTLDGSGSVAKSPDQSGYDWGQSVQLTATPDAGWAFAGWSGDAGGMTNPVSVTIGGSKAVTAKFSDTVLRIAVTAPTGTSSHAQGAALPVAWTTNQAVASGQFSIWVGQRRQRLLRRQDPRRRRHRRLRRLGRPERAGRAPATASSSTTAPARGTPGAIVRPRAGDGRRDHAGFALTVTAPIGATSLAQGAALPVAWTTNQAVATGQFSIWVGQRRHGWYGGKILRRRRHRRLRRLGRPERAGRAPATASSSTTAPARGPLERSYGQAPRDGRRDHSASRSPSPPPRRDSLAQGAALPVAWTTNQAVASGQFSIWVGQRRQAGTAADPRRRRQRRLRRLGRPERPVEPGYRIFVYYRASPRTPGAHRYGQSPGTVDVTTPLRAHRQRPVQRDGLAQGAALPVAWTTNQAVATGQFSIWVGQRRQWLVRRQDPRRRRQRRLRRLGRPERPVEPGYRVFVYYRAQPADPWSGIGYGQAPGTVDVTTPIAVTVTPRPARRPCPGRRPAGHLDHQPGGRLRPVQHLGQVSAANGWYGGKIHDADGSAGYADSIDLNVPVEAGYRVFVYYPRHQWRPVEHLRATRRAPWTSSEPEVLSDGPEG